MGAGSVGVGVASSIVAGDVPFLLQGTELELQPGHVSKAIALLIEQFKNKPKIQNVVRAIVTEIQELEAASFEVLLLTSLDSAVGVQLDVIGRIVTERRGGRADEPYRLALRARVLINKSKGTHEEILSITRAVLTPSGGAAPSIVIVFRYPANFEICAVEDPLLVDAQIAFDLIKLAVGAGVGSFLVFRLSDDTFQFSSTSAPEIDATLGFADETQTTGGHLAGVVT